MILTEEKLTEIVFSCDLSSGPIVYIFYSEIDDDIYATLYHRQKHISDIVIHTYNPCRDRFDSKEKIINVIKNFFKKESRDNKINKLLGDE
jgi:hypothetical protein